MDDNLESLPLPPEPVPSPGFGPTYDLWRDWLFGVYARNAWRA